MKCNDGIDCEALPAEEWRMPWPGPLATTCMDAGGLDGFGECCCLLVACSFHAQGLRCMPCMQQRRDGGHEKTASAQGVKRLCAKQASCFSKAYALLSAAGAASLLRKESFSLMRALLPLRPRR